MKFRLPRHALSVLLSVALVFPALVRLAFAAAPAPVPGGFTLAVLPDTQIYAWKYPETYPAQTKWLADNARRYNLRYVLHVGDITQHNTNTQWQVAARAHALLDAAGIPCAITTGNHDLGPEGRATSRETPFAQFFPLDSFRQWKTFGGIYDREPERTDNNFHLFEAGGRKWLILCLEFGPRDDVLRWANEVVARHPDRAAILVTHAYLRPDNNRFNRHAFIKVKNLEVNMGLDRYPLAKAEGGFNDGEDIWKKLVSQHANFALVVSGHVCYTGRLDSPGRHGNVVHQMVVDYQSGKEGGQGFLRLLQFHPDGKRVSVADYSPLLDQLSDKLGTSYEFQIAPAAALKP
jgi:hypothetical protein